MTTPSAPRLGVLSQLGKTVSYRRYGTGSGFAKMGQAWSYSVTHNDDGTVEGVKYDHLNVVLINSVKEQQAQIEDQQKRLTKQQEQSDPDHPELRNARIAQQSPQWETGSQGYALKPKR